MEIKSLFSSQKRNRKIALAVVEVLKTYPPVMYPPEFMADNQANSTAQLLNYFSRLSKTINCTTPSGQWTAYQDCSLVQSIIEKRVEYLRAGYYEIVDDNLEEIDTTKSRQIFKLINNPNPLQSRDEFEATVHIYLKIYGYCPLYKVMPANRTAGLPTAIWAIDPMYFNYVLTGKMYMQSTLHDIISSVSFSNPAGEMITLTTADALNNLWILTYYNYIIGQ